MTASRKNDPVGTRDRILDAASALFQAHGYGGTTTQRVAAVARVSHGAMHHHFPTKKALGLAVIRDRVSTAVSETWIAPLASSRSGRAGVASVFEAISRELDERGRVLGCPLNNLALELSVLDADFRAEIRDVFAAWRSAVAARLRADRHARGARRDLDVDALATFIVAAYSGAMALAKADQSSAALRVVARQLESMRPRAPRRQRRDGRARRAAETTPGNRRSIADVRRAAPPRSARAPRRS